MNSIIQKPIYFVKKHKIFSVLFIITILLSGWWTIVSFMPHPLGSKMEHLGKENYGNILGFDSRPYSVYYYGTDISESEVKSYFSKATLEDLDDETTYSTIMRFHYNGEDFYVTYYSDKHSISFKTSKKYIISIPSFDYDLARNSL